MDEAIHAPMHFNNSMIVLLHQITDSELRSSHSHPPQYISPLTN